MKAGNICEIKPEESEVAFNTIKKGAEILRDDFIVLSPERTGCKNMIAGYTVVYPNCRTRGHSHEESEEVYFIVKGKGAVVVGDAEEEITGGDIIYVPAKAFHQAKNTGTVPLEFFWVVAPPYKRRMLVNKQG